HLRLFLLCRYCMIRLHPIFTLLPYTTLFRSPFAREYGGLLDNRSFGGVQVSRTFYARGQTGQQLLLGAYQAMERQVDAGTVEVHTRHEMLDLIIVPDESGQERARGIVVRDMVTGEIETHTADAVLLCTGGYGNVYFLSTNAMGCNTT